MRIEELTDEELMLKYQKGDAEAFLVLYARLSSKVYGYLIAKVRNREKANDILQEVFVKIHKTKHLYSKEFKLLPWVFTMTKHLVIDDIRKNKNEKLQVDIQNLELASEQQDTLKNDLIEDLKPALRGIAPNQRVAIEMRYYDEKSFDEIAKILDTNSENVRQLISRGIKRVKEILGEEK